MLSEVSTQENVKLYSTGKLLEKIKQKQQQKKLSQQKSMTPELEMTIIFY